MSTRKRKQDEELVALPSDESEEEEEYAFLTTVITYHRASSIAVQLALLELPHPSKSSKHRAISCNTVSGAFWRSSGGFGDESLRLHELTVASTDMKTPTTKPVPTA
jgi:hypothetical protein